MNKRIIFSGMTIVAALSVVAGVGTFAELRDIDDNPGNTVQAGTLFLEGDTTSQGQGNNRCNDFESDDYAAAFTTAVYGNFRPETELAKFQQERGSDHSYQVALKNICVRNGGSVDGVLSTGIKHDSIVNYENERLENEKEAGDDSDGERSGEFGDQLQVQFVRYAPQSDAGGNDTCVVEETTSTRHLVVSSVNSLSGDRLTLGDLGAGKTACVAIMLRWTDPAGDTENQAISDSITADIKWELVQREEAQS